MYLVSIHDVLIEGAKFSIQAIDGSVHSNLLPWEIKQQVTESAIRINEPIRIKAARTSRWPLSRSPLGRAAQAALSRCEADRRPHST